MNKVQEYNEKTCEEIKKVDEFGNEYWEAREMQKVLEYTQWRRFKGVIDKAIIACEGSNYKVLKHFANVGKALITGNNTKMIVDDYKLSRYACYLIVQHADTRKKVIALGQTYFAIQTRKQELTEKRATQLNELVLELVSLADVLIGNIKRYLCKY